MPLPPPDEQLAILQTTLNEAAHAKTEEDRFKCILNALLRHGFDDPYRIRVSVADKQKTFLELRYVSDNQKDLPYRNIRYKLGGGVAEHAFLAKADSVGVLPLKKAPDTAAHFLFRGSCVALPLFRDGHVLGVLTIDHPEPNSFSDFAVLALETYGYMLGPMLDYTSDLTDSDFVSIISRARQRQVLVLGKDNGPEFDRLIAICNHLRMNNYEPLLVKQHPDIPELSNEEKVRVFADHSRFVILENSFPAGQIAELKMCSTNRIVTGTLRESGKGSSFMVTDYFKDYNFIGEFVYDNSDDSICNAVKLAVDWAEAKIQERIEYYNSIYPWRAGG